MTEYAEVDLDIEELVFLWNAEEGNNGIYELIWELGYYNLSIEDKYKIAHQLLKKLVLEELVTLSKHTDLTFENKIETLPWEMTEDILNKPSFWYPSGEIIAIILTEKGQKYLDEKTPLFIDKLEERWGNKNNTN